MLHRPVNYGNVNFDKLYFPGERPVYQSIAAREKGYDFDKTNLKDFDILSGVYDASFFNIVHMTHTVTVDEVSRPDLISYRNYQDPDFWSFILMFNGIADPMNGYTAGQTLKIPNFDRLTSWLTRKLIQEKKPT